MQRIVVITGGTGALGSAVSLAFLRAGDRVVVTYRSEAEWNALQAEAGELSGALEGITTDVTRTDSVKAMVDDVVSRHGRIDVVAMIAGGYLGGVNVADTSDDQWDRMMSLNLTSVFVCARAVLPGMIARRFGRIITVGSRGALEPPAGAGAYAASKAAVLALTQTIAAEGSAHNVRANSLVPSMIDTAANRAAMPDADTSSWVKPEKLAALILFLCSDDGDQINGEAIKVYG